MIFAIILCVVDIHSGPRITLGYWAIQGLGSAARMMLCYADVEYENVMYTQKGI